MVKFILPGLYEHFGVNQSLIQLKQSNPEFFETWDFGAIYGNFQFCIWDGGRIFGKYTQASYEQIIFIRNFLLQNNIPLRMIFTNPIVEEIHYYDNFCNLIARLCEHPNNEIVINNEGLEQYLRTNYPQYSFISSTTKCLNRPEDSRNELQKDYKYICLDYNLNHNETFIKSLSQDLIPKVEILVNAICPPGCPNRHDHYVANGVSVLNYNTHYGINCNIVKSNLHPSTFSFKNNLSPEEIYGHYSQELNISCFKLEGRTFNDLELALNYARYLVKSEYQFEFISAIMELTEINNKNFDELRKLT